MPVEFTCDGCNRRLRAPDAKAGKRTNCPTCGKELQIPVMGMPGAINLPSAGMPIPNPLDKLAAAIPTASEAAAGFNLTKPFSPELVKPASVNARLQAEPIEIGLADEAPPAPATPSSSSSSSSGIGNTNKSKSNAWRGGEKAPPPSSAALATGKSGSRAAVNPTGLNLPAKTAPLVIPAAGAPVSSNPASTIPVASAAAASPLVPVAPTAPNPLDDIFKDIPQLAPVASAAPIGSGPTTFGGLKPVMTNDPFAAQGAVLPQTTPRWDQIAASASVSSNPYASPSARASGGYRSANIESVRTMVMVPGIFLLIGYSLLMIYALFNGVIVATILAGGLPETGSAPEDNARRVGTFVGMIVGASLPFLVALAGLAGSIKMVRMRSWGAALTAAILGLCMCLPFGIWGIVVLSMDNVRLAFEANDRRHGG
jgi:hypothetical protein